MPDPAARTPRLHPTLNLNLLATLAAAGLPLFPLPRAAADEVPVNPGDSVQDAIDVAADGDVVLVAPGLYFETVDMRGKAITLRGAGGPSVTILDGAGSGPVVMCGSAEGPQTVIEGLTIRGGSSGGGGGMWNLMSSPTVRGCVFTGNAALFEGGAMLNEMGAPMIVDCRFVGNQAFFGGAVANIVSTATFVNCLFSGNLAEFSGEGGAMDNLGDSNVLLVNCSFTANTAASGGAMANLSSSPMAVNCILWGNTGLSGANEVVDSGGGTATFAFCDVAGSGGSGAWDAGVGLDGGGNIDADPLFANASGPDGTPGTADDDLSLLAGSPCIDAGNSTAVPAGIERDLAGQPRFVDDPATPDSGLGSGPMVDMGAFELFVAPPPPPPPPPSVLVLALDVMPGTCPNVVKKHGGLRAALLGTSNFNTSAIDPASVVLARADGAGSPLKPKCRERRDVSSPVDGDACDCGGKRRGDRVKDLVLEFRNAWKGLALEPGEEVEVVVTGRLRDGTSFTASDCVRAEGKRRSCKRR